VTTQPSGTHPSQESQHPPRAAAPVPMSGKRAAGPILAVATLLAVCGAARAEPGWQWPVRGDLITRYANDNSRPYAGGMHRGIDIGAAVGTPVVAAHAGSVSYAGNLGSSGLTVAITGSDGRHIASYLHLSEIAVKRGASVGGGQRIGSVGTTGQRSTAEPHLHFGVRVADRERYYVDPLTLLPPLSAGQASPAPAVRPLAVPEAAPVGTRIQPARARAPAPRRAGQPAQRPARLPVTEPGPRVLPEPGPRSLPAPGSAPLGEPRRVQQGLARERGLRSGPAPVGPPPRLQPAEESRAAAPPSPPDPSPRDARGANGLPWERLLILGGLALLAGAICIPRVRGGVAVSGSRGARVAGARADRQEDSATATHVYSPGEWATT
jgi:hypothetical protein